MKIITLTYADLIVGTVYEVKFNILQRISEYIYIVSNDTSSVEFQYCDADGVQIPGTLNIFANLTDNVFIIQF